jgi:hypothetical protein
MAKEEEGQFNRSPACEGSSRPELEQLPSKLEAIATLVASTAQQHQGQSLELLALLRLLEALHQEIRDGLFQRSLPDNRQALYALLRDIESEGGWPYIHRMKLQEFLADWFPEQV